MLRADARPMACRPRRAPAEPPARFPRLQRPTRQPPRPAERATDREVGVVAAVLAAGSEMAAAHRLGLSHSTVKHHPGERAVQGGGETAAQLVWILAPRIPEPEGVVEADE